MSVKALSAAFEDSRARDSAFVVLLAMADWADQNGRCYPSYRQIASKARVSRATAIAAVRELVALGELERVEHGQTPLIEDDEAPQKVRAQWRNLYRIALLKPRGQVVQPSDHVSPPSPPTQVVDLLDHLRELTDSQVVQPASAGGLTDTSQVVQPTSLHIRIRPSGRPSGRPSEELQAGAAPRAPEKITTENPAENIGVITKIAHEVFDLIGASHEDVPESIKSFCASRRIAYDSTVVRAAIESAIWQRRRKVGA